MKSVCEYDILVFSSKSEHETLYLVLEGHSGLYFLQQSFLQLLHFLYRVGTVSTSQGEANWLREKAYWCKFLHCHFNKNCAIGKNMVVVKLKYSFSIFSFLPSFTFLCSKPQSSCHRKGTKNDVSFSSYNIESEESVFPSVTPFCYFCPCKLVCCIHAYSMCDMFYCDSLKIFKHSIIRIIIPIMTHSTTNQEDI